MIFICLVYYARGSVLFNLWIFILKPYASMLLMSYSFYPVFSFNVLIVVNCGLRAILATIKKLVVFLTHKYQMIYKHTNQVCLVFEAGMRKQPDFESGVCVRRLMQYLYHQRHRPPVSGSCYCRCIPGTAVFF